MAFAKANNIALKPFEIGIFFSGLTRSLVNLLFPYMVKYEGVISPKDACVLWVSILKGQV
jgi:hypothetical protein